MVDESILELLEAEKNPIDKIKALPVDHYTKDKLKQLAVSLSPVEGAKELYVTTQPVERYNNTGFSNAELFHFQKSIYATLGSFVMDDYTYVHFRYFPNEKNYRVLIDKEANITIGRRVSGLDAKRVEKSLKEQSEEFEPLVDFIQGRFPKARFNDEMQMPTMRVFNYTKIIDDKIQRIAEGLVKNYTNVSKDEIKQTEIDEFI